MNYLNEEIRAIRHTMSHLEMAIPLANDDGERLRLKNLYNECRIELENRLEKCNDS